LRQVRGKDAKRTRTASHDGAGPGCYDPSSGRTSAAASSP
jgi:hypothetical protein